MPVSAYCACAEFFSVVALGGHCTALLFGDAPFTNQSVNSMLETRTWFLKLRGQQHLLNVAYNGGKR